MRVGWDERLGIGRSVVRQMWFAAERYEAHDESMLGEELGKVHHS